MGCIPIRIATFCDAMFVSLIMEYNLLKYSVLSPYSLQAVAASVAYPLCQCLCAKRYPISGI